MKFTLYARPSPWPLRMRLPLELQRERAGKRGPGDLESDTKMDSMREQEGPLQTSKGNISLSHCILTVLLSSCLQEGSAQRLPVWSDQGSSSIHLEGKDSVLGSPCHAEGVM